MTAAVYCSARVFCLTADRSSMTISESEWQAREGKFEMIIGILRDASPEACTAAEVVAEVRDYPTTENDTIDKDELFIQLDEEYKLVESAADETEGGDKSQSRSDLMKVHGEKVSQEEGDFQVMLEALCYDSDAPVEPVQNNMGRMYYRYSD